MLDAHVDTTQCVLGCKDCVANQLNLCAAARIREDGAPDTMLCESTAHTIPARRMIFGPREWSEFVHVICSGWAMQSVALPDGRRQVLSILLPGEMASTANLFEPSSGRFVEAVTEVTYRKFKREEVKGVVFSTYLKIEDVCRSAITTA